MSDKLASWKRYRGFGWTPIVSGGIPMLKLTMMWGRHGIKEYGLGESTLVVPKIGDTDE